MSTVSKYSSQNCRLVSLSQKHLATLYAWKKEEKNTELFTCRPVKDKLETFEEYCEGMIESISISKKKTFVLAGEDEIPLGRIVLFDYNPRNHSAEFGYYMPECNRALGIGSIMLSRFLDECFETGNLDLNKLYASTSSGNRLR